MQTQSGLKWLHIIRQIELDQAKKFISEDKSIRILEIGSGTGYMLQKIQETYPKSVGLEVYNSAYEFVDPSIAFYNGRSIPFPDSTFDVVFSSHVLEHIKNIDEFLVEIKRVLKPDGVCVHIMPSSTWRILTSLMHYFALFGVFSSFFSKKQRSTIKSEVNKRTKSKIFKFLLYSQRHGEYGNVISEIYYFSRTRWKKTLLKAGCDLKAVAGTKIVYWGRDVFRTFIPVKFRNVLSKFIGSSSYIYVFKFNK